MGIAEVQFVEYVSFVDGAVGLPFPPDDADFTDDFNRPDEPLETSASWTRVGGTSASIFVANNAVRMTTAEAAYLAPTLGTPDHFVRVDWLDAVSQNPGGFVCCRLTDNFNFVGMRYRIAAGVGMMDLYKRVGPSPGTFTNLGAAQVTITGGETGRLECVGDTARVLFEGQEVIAAQSLAGSHATVQTAGLVSRVVAQNPFVDNFAAGSIP